jgi:hypothetical protein
MLNFFVIHAAYIYSARHSGEGRNPGNQQNAHAVGQHPKLGFVRYAELYDKLDSGFRRNDRVRGFACCR